MITCLLCTFLFIFKRRRWKCSNRKKENQWRCTHSWKVSLSLSVFLNRISFYYIFKMCIIFQNLITTDFRSTSCHPKSQAKPFISRHHRHKNGWSGGVLNFSWMNWFWYIWTPKCSQKFINATEKYLIN